MIARTMTDQEMAFWLAKKIIKQQVRISALEDELELYRNERGQPIPWKAKVHRAVASPEYTRHVETRLAEILNEVDGASPNASLIQILHRLLSTD
jgi:hypothetical protein